MERPDSFILVIFGASGDLTKRKLIPALFALYKLNLLPDRFAVLGVSRSDLSDPAFRERITWKTESRKGGKWLQLEADYYRKTIRTWSRIGKGIKYSTA